MAIITDEQRIADFLTRGVEEVYPDRETVARALMSGKRLRIYAGFDPTAPTLHIGHGMSVRKLAQLQDLGHEVIFLIGDYTAMIGDPTDKGAARTQLTRTEVLANCRGYKKQVESLIRFSGKNAAKIAFNSKWFGKMKFSDVLTLASRFTVQQLLERDMFERRMQEGKPIFAHEFMYPMMQGYDSVALDVDMEIGGNDQTFNMLAGRALRKEISGKEKFVITLKLLTDSSGKKMGKSEGNMVALADTSRDMFGKVMSWSDTMIVNGFTLLTDRTPEEIRGIEMRLARGDNPRDFKLMLAQDVVAIYKSRDDADDARDYFISTFTKREVPVEMETVRVRSAQILDVLIEAGLVSSKSEGRRVIEQGGLSSNGVAITDISLTLHTGEHVLQKGKRHFVRVIVV